MITNRDLQVIVQLLSHEITRTECVLKALEPESRFREKYVNWMAELQDTLKSCQAYLKTLPEEE